MNLDTLSNEKKKDELKSEKDRIMRDWELLVRDIINACRREECEIIDIPIEPCVLTNEDLTKLHILKDKENIQEYIIKLQKEYSEIKSIKPKVVDNFDSLQEELNETEDDIASYETNIKLMREQIIQEKASIRSLNNNLEIIDTDLTNNKDAAKLRGLGSELNCLTSKDICPVCHQHIQDSLLPAVKGNDIMSIDENIRHLNAQKEMLEYAKESHVQNKKELDEKLQLLEEKVFTLRRLAKTLRSDLYAVNENLSESLVYKKIALQTKIDQLDRLSKYIEEQKETFINLSNDWNTYLQSKK